MLKRLLLASTATFALAAAACAAPPAPQFNLRNFTGVGTVTVLGSDYTVCINKATGAATAVTLPASPNVNKRYEIKDCKGDAATNPITITPASGTIDGQANLVIATNFGSATLTWTGSAWAVMNSGSASGGGSGLPAGANNSVQIKLNPTTFGSVTLAPGQVAMGQVGAPIPVTPSGDWTWNGSGVTTVSKIGGAPVGSLATLNAAPAATLTGSALPGSLTSAPGLTTAAGGAFGTAAYAGVGTSGSTLCLLSTACNWAGLQTLTSSLAPPNVQVAGVTLTAADCGRTVIVNSAGAVNVTTLATAPLGCDTRVEQKGVGTVTIVDGAGATHTSPFSYTQTNGTPGATLRLFVDANAGGTAANFNITGDGAATGGPSATVVSVVPTTTTGLLITGDTDSFDVTFSAAVTVTGTPQLTLNTTPPAVVNYTSGSGTAVLRFTYTVAGGQSTPLPNQFSYLGTASSNALTLNSGTINVSGTPATLTNANGWIFNKLAVYTSAAWFASTSGSGTTCSRSVPCSITQAHTNQKGMTMHPVWVRAGTYSLGATIALNAAGDSNAQWFGYPGETTILDGGGTIAAAFTVTGENLSGGMALIFNGFKMDHFTQNGVKLNESGAFGGTVDISDNDIQHLTAGFGTANGCVAGATFGTYNNGAVHFHHNSCAHTAGMAIDFAADVGGTAHVVYPGFNGQIDVDHNVFDDNCQTQNDCGVGYAWDITHTLPQYNFNDNIVNLNGGGGAASPLYFDDNASHITIKRNVFRGTSPYWILHTHGGDHIDIENNVMDMTNVGPPANNATLWYYQDSPCNSGGNGSTNGCPNGSGGYDAGGTQGGNNVLSKNIIISNAATLPGITMIYAGDTGTGYPSTFVSPTIQNNMFFSYTGQTFNNTASTVYNPPGGFASNGPMVDTSPIMGTDPKFLTAYGSRTNDPNTWQLDPTSPALASPVNFTQIAKDIGTRH